MKKMYIMVVEHKITGIRKSFKNHRQGATPPGYNLVGVCGFYEYQKGA